MLSTLRLMLEVLLSGLDPSFYRWLNATILLSFYPSSHLRVQGPFFFKGRDSMASGVSIPQWFEFYFRWASSNTFISLSPLQLPTSVVLSQQHVGSNLCVSYKWQETWICDLALKHPLILTVSEISLYYLFIKYI